MSLFHGHQFFQKNLLPLGDWCRLLLLIQLIKKLVGKFMIKVLFCLLFSISVMAQDIAPKDVPMLEANIKIDGIMDEDIWQQALIIDMPYETNPGENIPAKEKTEAYLIDTGDTFIIGFKAYDSEPDKIRAYLRDRDSAYQDDFVGIIIDTYNDERRALEFFVNPLGVQMDLITTGTNEDDSWNAIWDSAGKINNEGYVVEMEIPYNEIQMPNSDGKKTWGLLLHRTHPRDLRRQYRNIKIDRNNSCFLCQSEKIVGFTNADRGLDLEITPTITGLAAKIRDPSDSDYEPTNTEFEAGVDINWGINSNTTFNATINPDFSQVESDSAQLNVNQNFALFFPERRSFFLENADYFNSNMRLVHTRNIADPDYGLRLVGKNGKNAYGVFYANDTITNILIPGSLGSGFTTLGSESDNFVGRYRRDFGENASTFGAIVTNRSSEEYSNSLVSFDLNYRFTEKDTLRVQYANSETEYPEEVAEEFGELKDSFSGNSYLARYQHNGRNLNVNVFHQSKGDGFRADSGFIGQVGITKSVIGASYRWIGGENNWWNNIRIGGDWDITHDQHDQMLEKEVEGNIQVSGPLQSHF
ncbi:MAG: carbohydrate binding family 9 domain-containing protein, partial [Bacteroidetes bacterium]|nr:carbohydrate binding family 9 domain-containing protein [Bacteroidota bacterium]